VCPILRSYRMRSPRGEGSTRILVIPPSSIPPGRRFSPVVPCRPPTWRSRVSVARFTAARRSGRECQSYLPIARSKTEGSENVCAQTSSEKVDSPTAGRLEQWLFRASGVALILLIRLRLIWFVRAARRHPSGHILNCFSDIIVTSKGAPVSKSNRKMP